MEMTADSVLRNTPPRLLIANQSTSQLIEQSLLAKTEKLASLPMDPSLGKALVIEGSEPTLLEEMQRRNLDLSHIILCFGIGIDCLA